MRAPILLTTLAAACATLTIAAADGLTIPLRSSVKVGPRILAFYYGWYGTPEVSRSWMHYEEVDLSKKRIRSHVRFPAQGVYDSTDPDVLKRHVEQAAAAGIQTLVCSWWGKGDQTDRSLRALLPLAAAKGLTVCPLYERVPAPGDPGTLTADWRYLLKEYGKSPGWLKVDGKPVFFLFTRAQEQLQPEEWSTALASMEKEFAPGLVVFAEGDRFDAAVTFDGLYHFNPEPFYQNRPLSSVAQNFEAGFRRLRERATRFRRIPVFTVTLGGRDAAPLRGAVPLGPRETVFYRTQWNEALKAPDTWVLINSFNQWHAGTELEPSLELGDTYLRVTSELARRHKSAGSVR